MFILKIDAAGNVLWYKVYGGEGPDIGKSIKQTADGGFICVALSLVLNGDVHPNPTHTAIWGRETWVVRLNQTGNIVWDTTIGGSDEEITEDIEIASDGNYLLGMTTESSDGNFPEAARYLANGINYNHVVLKLDQQGAILWQRLIGGTFHDYCTWIDPTSDGGCIAFGSTGSNDGEAIERATNPRGLWLTRWDGQGNLLDKKLIGGEMPFPVGPIVRSSGLFPLSVIKTLDNGYITLSKVYTEMGDVCGLYNPTQFNGYDYWVCKLRTTNITPPHITGDLNIGCTGTATITAVDSTIVGISGYLWSTGATTPSLTVSAGGAGTYTVTVTYNNRCTRTLTATISQTNGLTFTNPLISPANCTTASGSFSLDAEGGIAPYSYSLNGQTSNANHAYSNLLAGTYTVVASDANGCTGATQVVVTQNTPLVSFAAPTQTPAICSTLGSFTVLPNSGTAPYTYQNSQNTATNTLANLAAGSYTVSATDANGCTGNTIVTIVQESGGLTASTTLTQPLCAAETGSISVSPQGGTPPYTILPTTLTGLNSGTYTVSVTDANGCNTMETATIAAPLPLTLSVTTQNPTCGLSNGTIAANVQGGTAPYTISPAVLTALNAGNHIVNVTDSHNCSLTLMVNLSATPPITANILPTNPVCYGDASGSVLFQNIQNAVPPVVFSVDNGTFSPNNPILNLGSGQHIVTLQDATNCALSDTLTLAEGYQFSVNIGRDTALYFGDSLLLLC